MTDKKYTKIFYALYSIGLYILLIFWITSIIVILILVFNLPIIAGKVEEGVVFFVRINYAWTFFPKLLLPLSGVAALLTILFWHKSNTLQKILGLAPFLLTNISMLIIYFMK